MTNNAFSVKTDSFEGPFDALLGMIEKKKLHISTVSLSQIADDYITYVRENELKLGEGTLFVWTAATLMLIKSKHLLPKFSLIEEEEADISDLQQRLRVYELFSKQAEKLGAVFGHQTMHQAIFRKKQIIRFRPDERISIQLLREQFDDIFKTVQPEVFTPVKAVTKTRSLKEITNSIMTRIERMLSMGFHELTNGLDRKETAISFLAVLELFRQNHIDLSQKGDFEPIQVSVSDKKPIS